jgi:hypothetical protein
MQLFVSLSLSTVSLSLSLLFPPAHTHTQASDLHTLYISGLPPPEEEEEKKVFVVY